MGQSRSYHSALSTLFPPYQDAPADSNVPIARFQHRSSWKTWRSGQTVRRWHFTLLLSVVNKHRLLMLCAVNAHELERLKKRFMKLDRCRSRPSPAALCPVPQVLTSTHTPH